MKPLWVLLGVLAMVAGIHAAARVSVVAYPRIAMAPAALKLTARVEPHADNRLLRVTLDCEYFYSATERELEGLNAAKTHQLPLIEGVPPGQCVVTAEVATAAGKVLRATAVDVQILGGEPKP